MNAATVFPSAECFRHHEDMPDWERLGQQVVARRTELGFRSRADFAVAAQVSSRLLADIEKGRRSNFDQVTLSRLEAVLGWETGSVQEVVDGGSPRVRSTPTSRAAALLQVPGGSVSGEGVDEIDLVYASKSMSAEQKLKAIRQILLLRKQRDAELAAMLQAPADDDAQIEQQS